MALNKTLTTILSCLILSGATQVVSAANEAPATVDQAQIASWTQKGLALFDKGDMFEAIPYLQKAAKLGHAQAQAMLGYLYNQGEEVELALPFLEAAAAQHHNLAMTELAVFYNKGIVVKKDPDKAMELIQRAADAGYIPAWLVLAGAYEHGTPPLAVDFTQSLKYYQLAADQHDLAATVRIIHAYERGELGLAKDRTKADALRIKARQESDARAQEQQLKLKQQAAAREKRLASELSPPTEANK